ncbi:hypothetical protein P0136_01435 [Lentisphaerota bacterium ZTH]|nr:hypothetical protein JYG24_07425 [Lentisphaerota bacterium]WET06677.1 hypothetical protein P0136_01435 [Lentisphaerota bacterium ZTH]
MIGINLSTGMLIYLILWLVTIAILWARELWRVKVTDWRISRSHLFRCDHCQYAFLTKENSNITRCPRCNAMCILRKNNSF